MSVEPVLHGSVTFGAHAAVVLRGRWAMNEQEFASGATEGWEQTFQQPGAPAQAAQQQRRPDGA